ncbi:MAG TPA: hypothetical protein PKZ03_00665 [Methanothrix sp.]|nr:hypothetical protein [Methanothrix sp.]
MLLNRLLNLGEEECIFLAEESLQDLLDLPVTRGIMEDGLDWDRSIQLTDIGIALHIAGPEDFWLLLTDRYSRERILMDAAGQLGAGAAKSITINEGDFLRALIEYYALSLRDELLCESCSSTEELHYPEDRIARLVDLLRPNLSSAGEKPILEVCCGNGLATQALIRLGFNPFAMDSDRCELCVALKKGLMDPTRSFVLDARLLPRFFSGRPFHAVLGFMVGLIDASNWPFWREILLAAASLSESELLITVYSQKEANLIAKEMKGAGWRGEVIDNQDPGGIYDQWVYRGRREAL